MYSGTTIPDLDLPAPILLRTNLTFEEMRDKIYRAVYKANEGNMTHTALSLRVSVRTIQRHFKSHGR